MINTNILTKPFKEKKYLMLFNSVVFGLVWLLSTYSKEIGLYDMTSYKFKETLSIGGSGYMLGSWVIGAIALFIIFFTLMEFLSDTDDDLDNYFYRIHISAIGLIVSILFLGLANAINVFGLILALAFVIAIFLGGVAAEDEKKQRKSKFENRSETVSSSTSSDYSSSSSSSSTPIRKNFTIEARYGDKWENHNFILEKSSNGEMNLLDEYGNKLVGPTNQKSDIKIELERYGNSYTFKNDPF